MVDIKTVYQKKCNHAFILSSLLFDLISGGMPPSLRNGYENMFHVRLGESLTIKCPVEFGLSNEMIIFSWGKDDVSLNSASNTDIDVSYEQDHKFLKITSSTGKHSGLYFCDGTNGFGTARAYFGVQIYDPKVYNSKCGPYTVKRRLHYGAPCFPTGSDNMKKQFEELEGNTVIIKCPAIGIPPPTFKWLKDGKNMDWISNAHGKNAFQLQVSNIQKAQEGQYSCEASNEYGSVEKTFHVNIKKTYKSAHILGPRPLHILVREGESVSLPCVVEAEDKVVIQWGKQIKKERMLYYEKHNQKTFTYSNESYVILDLKNKNPIQDVNPNKFNTYSKTLKFPSVSIKNVAKYVCIAIGPQGEVDKRSVYLRISSDFSKQIENTAAESEPQMYVILYISVPIAIVIVCFCAMIFCVLSQRRVRHRYNAHRFNLKESNLISQPLNYPIYHEINLTNQSLIQVEQKEEEFEDQRTHQACLSDDNYYMKYDYGLPKSDCDFTHQMNSSPPFLTFNNNNNRTYENIVPNRYGYYGTPNSVE